MCLSSNIKHKNTSVKSIEAGEPRVQFHVGTISKGTGKYIPLNSARDGATGETIEHEGILHAQYCRYGGLYYQSCEIYGDDPAKTEEAIDMMAHSSELWSLCDNVPPLQVNPMLSLRSEMEYDQQVIERNQRFAYQGLLDN